MEQRREVRAIDLPIHVPLREDELSMHGEAEPEDGVSNGEGRCQRFRVLRTTLLGEGEMMAFPEERRVGN